MSTPGNLTFTVQENEDYDETWQLYDEVDGVQTALNLTSWTVLKCTLLMPNLTTTAVTLSQVSSPVQGIRPLTPLTAGKVRVRIDRATLAAMPDATGLFELTGDLVGVDPDLTRRVIATVSGTVRGGVTTP